MVVRYSNMLNNLSSINLTKLDVLTGLEEIKLGVGYMLNGQLLESIPSDLNKLAQVQIVYENFKGWNEDISNIRKF
jgi:adenylosuccinate synthase